MKIVKDLFSCKQWHETRLSRGWFRSIDLWVMGPARFRCATLLAKSDFAHLLITVKLPGIKHYFTWPITQRVK